MQHPIRHLFCYFILILIIPFSARKEKKLISHHLIQAFPAVRMGSPLLTNGGPSPLINHFADRADEMRVVANISGPRSIQTIYSI